MIKNYIYIILFLSLTAFFVSCDNDDVDTNNSIFDVEDLQKKNEFDKWIYENYTAPYNIVLKYKFDLMENNFDYYLTPAKFDHSVKFAQILKYCWLECYDEVAGIEFTKSHTPKEVMFVGSEALDYGAGSKVLATAAGGTQIVIYEVNLVEDFTYDNVVKYMHIIHHEFSHILDQKKKLDPLFGQISMEFYLGDLWQDYDIIYPNGDFKKLGFVSDYATSSEEEDYAETYSKYITMTDDQWNQLLEEAKGDYKGNEILERKVKMIENYLMEEWNVDLKELKNSIQRRLEKAATLPLEEFKDYENDVIQ